MTTNSNNFLKTALAILLLSNSVLIFYVFKQEQNQNIQHSELINLTTKLDLLIKNNFEKQSEKIPCLQIFVEEDKTQELKAVKIKYIENILIDSVEAIIPAPREEELPDCGFPNSIFYFFEAAPEKGMQSFYDYVRRNLNYPTTAIKKA
jgi:low affinity Fe/Cu permease